VQLSFREVYDFKDGIFPRTALPRGALKTVEDAELENRRGNMRPGKRPQE